MNEALRVKVLQRVDNERKHLAHFLGRERTIRKDLRQILFGIFRHHVEDVRTAYLCAAGFENAREMRMRKFRRASQTGQLRIGFSGVRADQFYSGSFTVVAGLGEKYRTVVRAAQILDQAETAPTICPSCCFQASVIWHLRRSEIAGVALY